MRNYRQAFVDFHRWLEGAGLAERPYDALTARDARDFVIEAQRRFDRRTLQNHVSGLRAFYKYWQRQGRLQRSPFVAVPLPKLEKRLPKFLTEAQMVQLLQGPQRLLENGAIDPFTAWRDRLVMELLYGGGLRVSELTGLTYGAIDEAQGVARVLGKGRKERVCPLGRVAMTCPCTASRVRGVCSMSIQTMSTKLHSASVTVGSLNEMQEARQTWPPRIFSLKAFALFMTGLQ